MTSRLYHSIDHRTTPWSVWLLATLSFVNGAYLLFDGLHWVVAGDFIRIGGRLGRWADLVATVGTNPMRLGTAFLVLGAAWCAGAAGLLLRRRWARRITATLAVVSLPYLVFGTLISAAILILLSRRETQASAGSGTPA